MIAIVRAAVVSLGPKDLVTSVAGSFALQATICERPG